MGCLLDTTVLVGLERARARIAAFVSGREEEEMFLSVISASELLHGVHRAQKPQIRQQRSAFVEAILREVPLLPADETVARAHACLWSDLEMAGHMIGLHDSWIAATGLAHGLRIVTANTAEFERVPGLAVEAWPAGA